MSGSSNKVPAQCAGSIRISSIDYFRVFSILAVIMLHTEPFKTVHNETDGAFDLYETVRLMLRFAVPYFFIISGYFWAKKIAATNDYFGTYWRMAKRIFLIFVVWSFFYAMPLNFTSIYEYGILGPLKLAYWRLVVLADHPLRTLFQGTIVHLWFLVGLLCALTVSTLIILVNRALLPIVALALYIFELLTSSYSVTSFGFEIEFNTRNGPFVSTLFFVIGWLLFNYKKSFSLKLGVWLVIIGIALQFIEAAILWEQYRFYPGRHEYLIGTIFFGVGVAVMALANPKFISDGVISKWGGYTLGVYVIHYYIIDLLAPINAVYHNILWEIAFPLVVYALSLTAVCLLANSRRIKPFVV